MMILAIALPRVQATAADNLATARPYTLSPPPNYKACTDVQDAIQLTDGVKKGANWLYLSTVGWKDVASPPSVEIDLGSVQPIREVRIYSVGGGQAGVFLPSQILLMVSDDGKSYHVADVLTRPAPAASEGIPRRTPHTLRLSDLHTRGRYVHVTLVATKRYVFLDEIEVIRGDHEASDVVFPPDSQFQPGDAQEIFALDRAHRRLGRQVESLREAVTGSESSRNVAGEVERLHEAIRAAAVFRRGEVEKLEARVRGVGGRWLSQRYARGLFWNEANPMSQHSADDVFSPPAAAEARVAIEGWHGEYESAAVNVINAAESAAYLAVSTSPLRSTTGDMIPWGDRLTLRRAVYVETPGAGVVGDALVRLCHGQFPIAPGSAAQLWITAHLRDLDSGVYDFSVRIDRIEGSGAHETITVPCRVTVRAPSVPQSMALHTFHWGYLSRFDLKDDALQNVVKDLTSHYTDVYTIPGTELPHAKRGKDGAIHVDFARFDRAVARYPDTRRYLFWWGYKPGRVNRHRFGDFMSPDWKTGMRRYLTEWVSHLRAMGIGYDRFAMYPFDESLADEFLELARFIKETDPKIAVFANSVGDGDLDRIDRFAPYVDIWCLPERKAVSTRVSAHLRRTTRAEVWRYNASGDAKSLSPYAYYRLMPWRAWDAGETGCAFWVYATGRENQACNGWNDFTCTRGRWSVVYDGWDGPLDACGETFIPSRRWEAWREGIEDYEYLYTLDALIKQSRRRGVSPEPVTKAASVLAEVVAAVLADVGDADRAYDARRRLTAEIETLQKALDERQGPP